MASIMETERLLLRAWRLDEIEQAFAVYGDPVVTRHLGDGIPVPDLAEMRVWLEERIRRHAVFQERGFGGWAIVEREGGRAVGTALLKPLPPENRDIEIGWHLARSAWGRGYASEAARALLRHGFQTLGLERIHAVVQLGNDRSCKVALGLGMRRAGQTTKYYDGEVVDLFVMDRAEYSR